MTNSDLLAEELGGSHSNFVGVSNERQLNPRYLRTKHSACLVESLILVNMKYVQKGTQLEFPVNTFDAAVSCFGFQIVTQPEAAAKEIFRVLKSGCRAGFTVWSKGDRAQAIDVLIEPMMEHATPDEDGYLPTPYELGGPGELVNMLKEIGFVNPTEVRTVGNFVADGVEDYLSMVLVGTPFGHSLSEETEEVQKAVRAKAKGNISRYATAKGVSIPTECVIVVASKPA